MKLIISRRNQRIENIELRVGGKVGVNERDRHKKNLRDKVSERSKSQGVGSRSPQGELRIGGKVVMRKENRHKKYVGKTKFLGQSVKKSTKSESLKFSMSKTSSRVT